MSYEHVIEQLKLATPLDLALGRVPGVRQVTVMGLNPAVGTTAENIWEVGGALPRLTATTTILISSESANDIVGGSGCERMQLEGLDANGAILTEVITLVGTTGVVCANQYMRMRSMMSLNAGSYGEASSRINAKTAAGSIISQAVQGCINNGAYTTPQSITALIMGIQFWHRTMVTEQDHRTNMSYIEDFTAVATPHASQRHFDIRDVDGQITIDLQHSPFVLQPLSEFKWYTVAPTGTGFISLRMSLFELY